MSFKEKSDTRYLAQVDCSTAQLGRRLQWQALDAAFQGSIFADWKRFCTTVLTRRHWNSHSWQMPRVLHDCNGWRESVSFRLSRFPSLNLLLCSGDARIGKGTSDGACHHSCFFVFDEHGGLQHAGAEWKESPLRRYHAYFIPSHVIFKDGNSFAYGASISIHVSATYPSDEDDDDVIDQSRISFWHQKYSLVV